MSPRARNWAADGGAAAVYFLLFPGDLAALAAAVVAPAEQLLRLTTAVAPGAYAVLVALVVTGGAVRLWGRRPARPPNPEVPHDPQRA